MRNKDNFIFSVLIRTSIYIKTAKNKYIVEHQQNRNFTIN